MTMLEGRAAVVTGASSGIGRAIALRLAQAGARVALADIAEQPIEGGETTLKLIQKSGGEAFFKRVDVSEVKDIEKIVSDTVVRYGSLDIMINNAATYVSKPLLETSEDEWRRVIDVNLTGMFLGCKLAIQVMLNQEPRDGVRGRIVNITSQHGMISAPRDFAYGVSKAGGVYMTRQIAADYARELIICNAVAPGKILTGKPGAAVDPEKLDYARRRTPLPRFGKPEDVANAVLYLASDQATFVTGINLLVDGGWMAA